MAIKTIISKKYSCVKRIQFTKMRQRSLLRAKKKKQNIEVHSLFLERLFRSPELAIGWRPSSCVVRRATSVLRRALHVTSSSQELLGQS